MHNQGYCSHRTINRNGGKMWSNKKETKSTFIRTNLHQIALIGYVAKFLNLQNFVMLWKLHQFTSKNRISIFKYRTI